MATFVQWMHEQELRQDAVGEFARWWFGQPDKPKVSSPPGVAREIEARNQMTGEVQAGYDVTLKEYRAKRAQIAQATVQAETGRPVPPQPPATPGTDQPETTVTISQPGQITGGLGGAGSVHAKDGSYGVVPPGERAKPENAYTGWPRSLLMQILDLAVANARKIELICDRLGIADTEDGVTMMPAEPFEAPMPGWYWQEMWDMADLSAEA